MICKSPKRYEKAFASLLLSTPGTAASLDLSHLCFTKERGSKTGAIKIYDTSQEKDTGAILWKRSRFHKQGTVAVSVAGSYATAIWMSTNELLVCQPGFNTTKYLAKVTSSTARIVPEDDHGAGKLFAKLDKDDKLNLRLLRDGSEPISLFIETDIFSIGELFASFIPWRYPNLCDRKDRLIRQPLAVNSDEAAVLIALWAQVRFCMLPWISSERSNQTSSGSVSSSF